MNAYFCFFRDFIRDAILFTLLCVGLFFFVHTALVQATERDCSSPKHAELCGDGSKLAAVNRLSDALKQ